MPSATTLLSSPVRKPLPTMLLVLFGALLAACGGGGTKTASSPSTGSTTTTTSRRSDSTGGFAAYSQCVTSHGGHLPARRSTSTSSSTEVSTPPSTVDQATSAAMQACASLRPTGGGGFLNSPQAAAYRNCLTQHGVTLPAPGSAGGGNNGTGPNSSLANNPAFQAAAQACAPLRPARSSTTSTT